MDDRLLHSIGVARKAQEIALNKHPGNMKFAEEMFVLGWLHDIGKEYGNPHESLGGKILMRNGYKYWEEIANHGKPNTTYKSEALDILNEADMTTDLDGKSVSYETRLQGIEERYGKDSTEYQSAAKIVEGLKGETHED